MYAWVIDEDLLAEVEPGFEPGGGSDVGRTGPADATGADLYRLATGAGDVFELYDDDRNLYYRGRLVVPGDTDADSEEASAAPLLDFGAGWAGCTEVRWPNHPYRDCG